MMVVARIKSICSDIPVTPDLSLQIILENFKVLSRQLVKSFVHSDNLQRHDRRDLPVKRQPLAKLQ